jgi:hypothetical protein
MYEPGHRLYAPLVPAPPEGDPPEIDTVALSQAAQQKWAAAQAIQQQMQAPTAVHKVWPSMLGIGKRPLSEREGLVPSSCAQAAKEKVMEAAPIIINYETESPAPVPAPSGVATSSADAAPHSTADVSQPAVNAAVPDATPPSASKAISFVCNVRVVSWWLAPCDRKVVVVWDSAAVSAWIPHR